MLHLYYGSDTSAVRAEALAAVAAREAAGARLHRLDAETYRPGALGDALGATSLFGGEECYLLDTPSAQAEFAAAVVDALPELAASANTFVVIEGPLLAKDRKAYEPHAAALNECKVPASERFNAFGMADALARKDKRGLWLLLTEARRQGLSAEEIIGTLWWQLKTLRLAALTDGAAAAGMKDFPYQKAKRALGKFAPGEVEVLCFSLLSLYHAGHAGERDLDLAFERWALSL